jgi:CBS domain-containing protein
VTGIPSPAPDYEEQLQMEEDPSRPADILPDEITRGAGEGERPPARRRREGAGRPEAEGTAAVAVDAAMTREPVSIGPEATVEEAAGALLEAGVRHLPVVDTDGRIIGILSERDIRERIGADPREWFRAAVEVLEDQVGRIMVPDPITVQAGTPLLDVLEILERERVGAIPVVDQDDRLVGILSYVDALAWMREVLAQRRGGRGAGSPLPGT